MGNEAGDPGHRLDARQGAAYRAHSGHPRRRTSRGRSAAAAEIDLTHAQLAEIERALPLGFAAGERYSEQQWVGIQKY